MSRCVCKLCQLDGGDAPESAKERAKAMKQETNAAPLCMAVPVELVRELKEWRMLPIGQQLDALLAQLPDPPKPHPLEACGRAYAKRFNANEDHLNPLTVGGYWNRPALKAALREYRSQLGMDRDPELEDT